MKKAFIIIVVFLLSGAGFLFYKRPYLLANYEIGEAIDSLNHVKVFYNGSTSNVLERNTSADGYNIGLKFQCVEFVKRYYYEYYHHKMPNSYGHAFSFFDKSIDDATMNPDRGLMQYANPSKSFPEVGDLIVFDATSINGYGHVAIISEVSSDKFEIIQQNPGIGAPSRIWLDLEMKDGMWYIKNDRVLGYLRLEH